MIRRLGLTAAIALVAGNAFAVTPLNPRAPALKLAFPELLNPERQAPSRAFLIPQLTRKIASDDIEAKISARHLGVVAAQIEAAAAQAQPSGAADDAANLQANSHLAAARVAETAALAERQTWIANVVATQPEHAGILAETNTIIIHFRENASIPAIREVLDKYKASVGLRVRSGVATSGLFFTELGHNVLPEMDEPSRLQTVMTALRAEPPVQSAFFNTLLAGNSVPCKSSEMSWNFFDGSNGTSAAITLHLPEAWNFRDAIAARNTPVKIVILDEGFAQHDDSPTVKPLCSQNPSDHGNAILGIIAARYGNCMGTDGGTSFANLATCAPNFPPITTNGVQVKDRIVWFAAATKAFDVSIQTESPRIVNVSLGYNWKDVGVCPDSNPVAQQLIADVGLPMRQTLASYPEVIVVASAGNDSSVGFGMRLAAAVWNSPWTWAALSTTGQGAPSRNVFAVESYNVKKQRRSNTSDVGGTISAPGEYVVSFGLLHDEYEPGNGTSQATAEITAIVALMLAYNDALTVEDVRTRLGVVDAGQQANVPNAFGALASSRTADEVAYDLANVADPAGNVVDMADFQRFTDDLLDFESGHPQYDLNGDGTPDANDLKYPRCDFNGDGQISRDALAYVPGMGMVTDFDVFKRAWPANSAIPASQLVLPPKQP